MGQLGGSLVILGISIVIPVALAWVVAGGAWRIVRNACLIWYGFLFLAGGVAGGFADSDQFGWAIIIAMFYSIPVVPGIALVLRAWAWLGRRSAVVASVGPGRFWLQRFPLSLLSPAQWLAVITLVVAAFVGNHWYTQRDLNARLDVLRPFFELPVGAKFASIVSQPSPDKAPRLTATVRFTEQEFRSFTAQIDQAPRWRKQTPSYDGAPVEVPSPDNIRWRDMPVPLKAGDRFVTWNRSSATEVRGVQRGRVSCVALQRKPGNQRDRKITDAPRYVARDCGEVADTERVHFIVAGALDLDTRTLHMMIR